MFPLVYFSKYTLQVTYCSAKTWGKQALFSISVNLKTQNSSFPSMSELCRAQKYACILYCVHRKNNRLCSWSDDRGRCTNSANTKFFISALYIFVAQLFCSSDIQAKAGKRRRVSSSLKNPTLKFSLLYSLWHKQTSTYASPHIDVPDILKCLTDALSLPQILSERTASRLCQIPHLVSGHWDVDEYIWTERMRESCLLHKKKNYCFLVRAYSLHWSTFGSVIQNLF